MWVLEPQEQGDLDAMLDKALTQANGTPVYSLSIAERAAIHAVCKLYDALLGQPNEDLTPEELDNVRPWMKAAYRQVQIGARLATLRARILVSTDSCPYCGFGEPRDLDHYLPISLYGELAIYPNNLIPSCAICNNAKRRVVPGVGPAHGPGLIHPYFQLLPDQIFLKADIVFAGGALEVSFHIDAAGVDEDLATNLQFQLDRLKLNERYPKQINKFLSEQRTAMLTFNELDPDLFSDYLQRSAESLANTFGLNDWRVALLYALADDADFYSTPEHYFGLCR